MYQKINNPMTGAEAQCIKRLADNAFIPMDDANTDYAEYKKWLAEGNEPLPADAPTQEQITAQIVADVQKRLDDFARTRNYDGILSLTTYATSAIPKFAAEGQYGVGARDATWATMYQIEQDVLAGNRPPPQSYADIESELPELSWPA